MAGTNHNFLLGDYNPSYKSSVAYSNEIKETQTLLKENAELEYKVEKDKTFLSENVIMAKVNNKSKSYLLDEAYTRGAERAFVYTLTDIYVNSLYLDEAFIVKNDASIRNYFVSSIKEQYPDISELMESVKHNSKYLLNLVESSKKTGNKRHSAAKKKLDEDGDTSQFDIDQFFVDEDDKEKKQKDYINMNNQEISNIVKDKVLQTVKDEDANNKKEQEFMDDINKAKSVNESVTVHKNGFKEFSLFKGLMTKHYKETIESLKESTQPYSDYGVLSEDADGNTNIKVDMDYVMCDALLEYTKIELLNTMKITNLKSTDIREMANSFAYSVK